MRGSRSETEQTELNLKIQDGRTTQQAELRSPSGPPGSQVKKLSYRCREAGGITGANTRKCRGNKGALTARRVQVPLCQQTLPAYYDTCRTNLTLAESSILSFVVCRTFGRLRMKGSQCFGVRPPSTDL